MKNICLPVLLLISLSWLIACDGNVVTDHKAKMRMINASYNAGDINLDVDYEPVYASNVQYLNFGLFREFIEGTHRIQVKNTGGSVIVDTSLFMTEYRHYSLFVYDSMNTLRYKVIDENFVTPVGSNCKVRFMNFANSAPTVDIVKVNDTGFNFRNYPNGRNSEFLNMGVGMNQFEALNSATQNSIYVQAPYEYKAGYFYTVFLRGNMGATGNDSLSFFVIENNQDYQ